MANTKFSGATATTTLASTDVIPVASSGASKKITGANLRTTLGSISNLYPSGCTILPWGDTGFPASALTQNLLNAYPMLLHGRVTFASISISCTTLAASSSVRLGFYDVGSDGGPGALLYDLGTVDTTSTGVKTITSTFTLGPGLVWYASVAQGGAPSVRGITYTNVPPWGQVASKGSLTTTPFSSFGATASASGALPDPFGAYAMATTSSSNSIPRFILTVA